MVRVEHGKRPLTSGRPCQLAAVRPVHRPWAAQTSGRNRTGVRRNESNCGKTHQSRFGDPGSFVSTARRVWHRFMQALDQQENGGHRKDTVRLDQTFGSGKVGQRMVPERWITPAVQTNELAGTMTLSRLWACLK